MIKHSALVLIKEYRDALLEDMRASRGNDCLNAARAECVLEDVEQKLLKALTK